MELILNDLVAWHWAVVGAALGALTLLLLYVTNVRLGMSTGFESLCSLFSRQPYFRRPSLTSTNLRRYILFAGCLVGGVVSAVVGGGWVTTWDMGRFDMLVSDSSTVKVIWMFVGGVFVGFGTRLGSGCTSGHAVFGFPHLEKGSIRAMFAFMAAGVVMSNVMYRLIFT